MTLRQALGSLEARGYIERRRGRAGGNFVREPRIAFQRGYEQGYATRGRS